MSRLVFLDTETTGLDPDRHNVWEVAVITGDGQEYVWMLDCVDLAKADPMALKVSGFHERYPLGWNAPDDAERDNDLSFCLEFGRLTYGAHLVGAVPSFDAAFLRRLFLKRGFQPGWHYHLIDVEALAVGWLRGRINAGGTLPSFDGGATPHLDLPWRSDDLSRACGVEPPSDDERHTALGDARWVKRWYEAITGGGHD